MYRIFSAGSLCSAFRVLKAIWDQFQSCLQEPPTRDHPYITSVIDAVTLSGILKAKQRVDVTFKNDNVQGLRSKFRKIVIDPLLFGQKKYKGLLFYQ